jgi:hypothetical protein
MSNTTQPSTISPMIFIVDDTAYLITPPNPICTYGSTIAELLPQVKEKLDNDPDDIISQTAYASMMFTASAVQKMLQAVCIAGPQPGIPYEKQKDDESSDEFIERMELLYGE